MTYIDPRAKALAHVDRIVDWNRGRKPAPVTVEFDLSNRCVLGCRDCHFAHTHVKGPWTTKDRLLPMAYDTGGDLADMALLMRALGQMSSAGVQGIVWSGGGEPTTHPQWQDALSIARGYGLRQGMYTLGGLLTKESAGYAADRLSWVVVSLDCADAETYSEDKGVPASRFEAACNGIRWLADAHRAVVGVSFLLNGRNWHRAHDMLALARTLGATYATFRPVIDTSPEKPSVCASNRAWVADAAPTLTELADEPDVEVSVDRFWQYRNWDGHGYDECQGVRLNATITPDGRVWPCPQRRGIAGSCLGDLRTESFTDIWARHPGKWAVDSDCRVMCRLHPVNQTLHELSQPRAHEAFV